jgi:hypothetical protein
MSEGNPRHADNDVTELTRLRAENERLREALIKHHQWHQETGVVQFFPDDDNPEGYVLDLSLEYSDSSLCEQTIAALAKSKETGGMSQAQPVTIRVHAIAQDGLPNMDDLTGRVAFIFDGCIVSGWPLLPLEHAALYERLGQLASEVLWEGNGDVSHRHPFIGVTHWIEFPVPVWDLKS